MISKPLLDQLKFPVTEQEVIQSGPVNRCHRIASGTSSYFLKVNNASGCPMLFEKEYNALKALSGRNALRVPEPLKWGIAGEEQYLLLEWMDTAAPLPKSWELLGSGLARIHREGAPYFGFFEDNYLSVWPQENTVTVTWPEFYGNHRILPLIRELYHSGILTKADSTLAERFCRRLPELFPDEQPALLHGDLWSGNILFTMRGEPVVVDPAVYYGHREMDIGMTLLFGGFTQDFYSSYEAVYPLSSGWRQRLPFSQLYPLLIHAFLFGGNYVSSVRAVLNRFR
ncbi:fructosamine kinase family protein [Niabella beijingensis]|uniref:fructosamine kinase family protein n=1 Tax=Niabella beijingensis TaxID=2872700 RepID=UPI001CBE384A|nr:fructosamine kinase family protein [Niabella beijingensis]MBZ4191119.1 fructosamine kinase family protein [Niabella beijingensis]